MNKLSSISTEYLSIVAGLTLITVIMVAVVRAIANMITVHPESIMGVLSIVFLAMVAYRRLEEGYKWAAIVGAIAALLPALILV